ncbi:RNA polymerase sigma factor [Parapedobacter tibetensis]|uniref:RNA polymerase sigma factor n=1 Tax=Parapedobacter tibetensis TaxID=2972951 RepID=UPI00214D2662|nr:sigma-70 family RNA polymerase sigma factor [Parapedobacter tibetensis]
MKPTSATDERDLLLRLRDGDHHAFSHLYHQYSPALIANLIKLLKNDVLVEEVLQETFMALWEKRGEIDPDKPVAGYLFRISANKAKNLFKRAVHDEKMRAYFQPVIAGGYEQIETQLFQKENEKLLHGLLSKLPAKQREVYTLCKLEGLSYREVAECLGISESAVNAHIQRANAFLKEQLVNYPQFMLLLFAVLIT